MMKKFLFYAQNFAPENAAHIVNGECLKERVKKENIAAPVYAFNEAMCRGTAEETVFSETFIERRAQSLFVPKEEYEKITVKELCKALEAPALILWFGEDMFCQINLLTLLAWLEQKGYAGKVFIGTLREEKDEIADFSPLRAEGFSDAYRRVVIEKKPPQTELGATMQRAIELYFSFEKDDSPLRREIRAHLGEENLLPRLFAAFPEYGLGDLQYLEMIEEEKRKAN